MPLKNTVNIVTNNDISNGISVSATASIKNPIRVIGGSDSYTRAEIDEKFSKVNEEIATKQDTFTAGENVVIEDNIISVDIESAIEPLEERVEALEEGVTIYKYFYPENSSIYLPLYKTTYLLREFSSKDVLSNILTDCYVDFDARDIYDLEKNELGSCSDIVKLYQTGLESEIKTQRYGYDNVDVINKVINRYCYVISLPNLLLSFASTQWSWTGTGTANGRLSISHQNLATLGIFSENGITPKYTKDIGLVYKGISSSNFAINNLKSIEGITNKASAISILTNGDYDDVYIVFKRLTPIQESFEEYDLHFNITQLECDGENVVGLENFNGCLQASYLSLQDLVYSKDQADEKFLNKVDFNADTHIVRIGDPDTDEIKATLDIYNTTLKDFHYPKFAYAKCINPTINPDAEDPVIEVPFRGDTLFINQYKVSTREYGYLVISQGATYWMTKTDVSEINEIGFIPKIWNLSSLSVEDLNAKMKIGDLLYFGVGGAPEDFAIITEIFIDNEQISYIRLVNLTSPDTIFEWSTGDDESIEFNYADWSPRKPIDKDWTTLTSLEQNSHDISWPFNGPGIYTIELASSEKNGKILDATIIIPTNYLADCHKTFYSTLVKNSNIAAFKCYPVVSQDEEELILDRRLSWSDLELDGTYDKIRILKLKTLTQKLI